MTIIDTPDTLNTLPVWSVLGSLRAADLNILSEWLRWLFEAADLCLIHFTEPPTRPFIS